jgi:choline transport protein
MTVKGDTTEGLLGTHYAAPWVQILYNVTKNTAGVTVLTALVSVLLLFCTINLVGLKL